MAPNFYKKTKSMVYPFSGQGELSKAERQNEKSPFPKKEASHRIGGVAGNRTLVRRASHRGVYSLVPAFSSKERREPTAFGLGWIFSSPRLADPEAYRLVLRPSPYKTRSRE